MALTRRRISPVMPVPMSRGGRRMVDVVLCSSHWILKLSSAWSHARAVGVEAVGVSSSASVYSSP